VALPSGRDKKRENHAPSILINCPRLMRLGKNNGRKLPWRHTIRQITGRRKKKHSLAGILLSEGAVQLSTPSIPHPEKKDKKGRNGMAFPPRMRMAKPSRKRRGQNSDIPMAIMLKSSTAKREECQKAPSRVLPPSL